LNKIIAVYFETGCTAIIFSRIKILSQLHDVIPLAEEPRELLPLIDNRDESVCATLLLPSLFEDVRVLSYSYEENRKAAGKAASLAAAIFLFEVRGLLFDELTVRTDGGVERILYKENRFWAELDAVSTTKALTLEIMGVSAPYRLATVGAGKVLAVACGDLSSFDLSVLPLYLCHHNAWCGSEKNLTSGRESALGAVVYSLSSETVTAFSYFTNGEKGDRINVLSAISFLARADRILTVCYADETFYLLREGGRVLVSSSYERPMTFEFCK